MACSVLFNESRGPPALPPRRRVGGSPLMAPHADRSPRGGKNCAPIGATGVAQQLMQELGLTFIDFDGCAVGLKDIKGRPLLKPWRIATDHPGIAAALIDSQCATEQQQHESDMYLIWGPLDTFITS